MRKLLTSALTTWASPMAKVELKSAAQGSANVTHGCVNLSIDSAKSYYDIAQYGDPVEVTGTPVPLAARDGDIWDWTLSWDQWKKLSALS